MHGRAEKASGTNSLFPSIRACTQTENLPSNRNPPEVISNTMLSATASRSLPVMTIRHSYLLASEHSRLRPMLKKHVQTHSVSVAAKSRHRSGAHLKVILLRSYA